MLKNAGLVNNSGVARHLEACCNVKNYTPYHTQKDITSGWDVTPIHVLIKRIHYFCHEQQLSLWPLTPPPTPFPDLSCLPHKLPASPPKSPENGEQMARLQLQLPPFANSAAFSAVFISGMSSDCRRGQFDFCSTRQPAAWCYCYLSGFWPCTGKSVKHSTNFSDFLSCGKAGDTGTK